MERTLLDGTKFRDMLLRGAQRLQNHKEHVDSLNVFPVPDGDTGTNMSLTMTSAVNEINRIRTEHIGMLADAAARGSLMGARGNSGVILSQLIRGIAKELKTKKQVDQEAFAKALEHGYKTASEAVMKPMEGTILTVAREAAKAAVRAAKKSQSFNFLLEAVVEQANTTLRQTPEMLPVLKEAGVVDAGAKGWVLLLEGMYQGFTNETGVYQGPEEPTEFVNLDGLPRLRGKDSVAEMDSAIEFAYCTELLILNSSAKLDSIRESLHKLGDSMLVVGEKDLVKVHIHSNHPGQVLETCLKFGQLKDIKIENMVLQKVSAGRDDYNRAGEETMPYGFLVVSTGDGLAELFKSLGAQRIVSGGQTNNPSTEDLVRAMEEVNAEVIYVLPNNGNIILTAGQAAKLVDKRVEVIPTKSIPAGISAMLAFQPEKDIETNVARMLSAAKEVIAAEVTYAVRDTNVDGKNIKKDDIIGIVEDKIIAVGNDLTEVTLELIKKIVNKDSEIVTIIGGNDTTEELMENILTKLAKEFPDVEFESLFGGQPLYYFLISVE